MNDRPEDFPRAMATLLAQEGIDLRIVVVGNGCTPQQIPHADNIRCVALPDNAGIPEGRNVGARHPYLADSDHLFFFDNDAALPERDILAALAGELHHRPELAYVQPRITDPDTNVTLRRWVPRLRAGDPERGGTVTVMAEGVVMIRRSAFDAAGGWPGGFFLFHEGIDLSWRLWDQGGSGLYTPHIIVHHPATDPARHDTFYRLNARNRVLLARRNLPIALIPLNLATWLLLTLCRVRDRSALRTSWAGFTEGIRSRDHGRQPISWRTVTRLTIAGRPPIF
ncbi:glycosyltransferase family 2 protein [Streptomyces angustmyceticus]